MKYRSEIDGLRAIAVGSVVLYHAGLTALPGGFVGVDIFFVISGYLITRILLDEIADGRFTFRGFYERRARRILPALLLVLAFALLVAPLALAPSQYAHVPFEALAALFFVANIFLWRQSGYFAPAADEYPLLHTWSLGIEEQFYIFVPLLLLVLFRRASGRLSLWLLVLFALSFAISVAVTPIRAGAAFYLLPSRAWELLAGSLVAVGLLRPTKQAWMNEMLSVVGLVAILGAILFVTDEMAFPGSVAAVPVVGAALIIATAPGTRVAAFLSLKPIVGIGLISYSLYLWHWPLLVLGQKAGLLDLPVARAVAVVLAVVLAWLSWRFVERPFRNRTTFPIRPFLYSIIPATGALILAAAVLTWDRTLLYTPERIAFFARYEEARQDYSPERERCHPEDRGIAAEELCTLGGVDAQVAVWSDSHGGELGYALAEQVPVYLAAIPACAPELRSEGVQETPCDALNTRIAAYLVAHPEIETVIMTAEYPHRWKKKEIFAPGFEAAVAAMRAAGKRVIVLGPMPSPGRNVPTALSQGADLTYPRDIYERANAEVLAWLRGLPADAFVYPADTFCGARRCSMVDPEGRAMLFDHTHVTVSAARHFVPAILKEVLHDTGT